MYSSFLSTLFTRIVPEQNLCIVETFKANGEIVTMAGDGVNVVSVLKSANIDIATGERGTDVAEKPQPRVAG